MIHVPRAALIEAITAEVSEFFSWTEVEAVAQLESSVLARNVLSRLERQAQGEDSPTIDGRFRGRKSLRANLSRCTP